MRNRYYFHSVDLLNNDVTEVIKRLYKEAQNRLQAIKEEEFFKYGIPKYIRNCVLGGHEDCAYKQL